MAAKEIGLAIIGSGRIGTLRAKLAAGHPAVRFIAVSDADPAKARKLAESVGATVPFRRQRRRDRAARGQCRHRLDQRRRARRRRSSPRSSAACRCWSRSRSRSRSAMPTRCCGRSRNARANVRVGLQPPLQGALPDRQGADPPGPHRHHHRRRRAALQFALAGVCDPQARSARDAGGRRPHLLRRPDELVLRGPAHRRGLCARPDRRAEGRRPRRSRRGLCGVHLRRRLGRQSRTSAMRCRKNIRRSAMPRASSCSAPKASCCSTTITPTS